MGTDCLPIQSKGPPLIISFKKAIYHQTLELDMKYSYAHVFNDIDQLNVAGQEGWECYAVTHHTSWLRWLFFGWFLPPQKMYHLRKSK